MALQDNGAHASTLSQPRKIDRINGSSCSVRRCVRVNVDNSLQRLSMNRECQGREPDQQTLHPIIIQISNVGEIIRAGLVLVYFKR